MTRRISVVAITALILAASYIWSLRSSDAIPAFQQDWLWPQASQQCSSFEHLGETPWLTSGVGSPMVYPQPWLPYFAIGRLCDFSSPFVALLITLFAVAAVGVAAFMIALLIEQPRLSAFHIAAATVYWGNPAVYNETQAGHIFWLMSYAILPVVSALTILRQRMVAPALYVGVCVGICSAQQQFFIFALLLMTMAVLRNPRKGDVWFLLLATVTSIVVISPQWIEVVIEGSGSFSNTRIFHHWEIAQSTDLANAVRFLGYIGHYDETLPAVVRWASYLFPIVAIGTLISRVRSALPYAVVYLGSVGIFWGLRSPMAALFWFVFDHLRYAGIFRELYNVAGIGAYCIAFAAGIFLVRVTTQWPRIATGAVAFVITLAALPTIALSCANLPRYKTHTAEYAIIAELARLRIGRLFVTPPGLPAAPKLDSNNAGLTPWTLPIGNVSSASVPQAPFPLAFAQHAVATKDEERAFRVAGITEVVNLPDIQAAPHYEPLLSKLETLAPLSSAIDGGGATLRHTHASIVSVEPFTTQISSISAPYVGVRDIGPFRRGQIDLLLQSDFNPYAGWAPIANFSTLPSWVYMMPAQIVTMRSSVHLSLPAPAYAVLGSDSGKLRTTCQETQKVDNHFAIYSCSGSTTIYGAPPLVAASASAEPPMRNTTTTGRYGTVSLLNVSPWDFRVRIAASAGSAIVLREKFDKAWVCDGCGNARHVVVDGYANGWDLSNPVNDTVDLRYGPAPLYFTTLYASILVTCVAVVAGLIELVVSSRRAKADPPLASDDGREISKQVSARH